MSNKPTGKISLERAERNPENKKGKRKKCEKIARFGAKKTREKWVSHVSHSIYFEAKWEILWKIRKN